MSSQTTGSMRHRGEKSKKDPASPGEGAQNGTPEILVKAKEEVKAAAGSEWDYKIALVVVTILAFITRFRGISHPAQVVFDEVHFGKVRLNFGLSYHGYLGFHAQKLTKPFWTVCVVLPPTNLLLRRSSSLRKAPLRARRLDGWIQWRISLRQYRRFLYHKQSPIRRLSGHACFIGSSHGSSGLSDHVGVGLFPTRMPCLYGVGALR